MKWLKATVCSIYKNFLSKVELIYINELKICYLELNENKQLEKTGSKKLSILIQVVLVFKRTFCSAEQFGHFQAELFCSAEPNIYLRSSALAEHPKILYF